MTNAEKNRNYLKAVDAVSYSAIIGAIANHYQTCPSWIYDEVTGDDAEHLTDYLPQGTIRNATYLDMLQRGLI